MNIEDNIDADEGNLDKYKNKNTIIIFHIPLFCLLENFTGKAWLLRKQQRNVARKMNDAISISSLEKNQDFNTL